MAATSLAWRLARAHARALARSPLARRDPAGAIPLAAATTRVPASPAAWWTRGRRLGARFADLPLLNPIADRYLYYAAGLIGASSGWTPGPPAPLRRAASPAPRWPSVLPSVRRAGASLRDETLLLDAAEPSRRRDTIT
jgi:hypothetical protein